MRSFPDKLMVRLGLINTSNSFFVNDSENEISYNLIPNTREYLGVSLLFRSVELDFGFLPEFLEQNKDNSNSELFNLNFRTFLGQWMQTFNLYKQKGFFADFRDIEIPLSNIKSFKIGGSTSYIMNPNFSFRAIGFQNEWQKKSAGSFIPRLFYYYSKFNFNENNIKESVKSFDIAISPSYYHNFVIREKIILGFGASTGIGFNHNSSSESNINSVLFEFGGSASVGYHSKSFFVGVNSSFNVFEHKTDKFVRIDDTITFLEFYVGYRFKAPKSFIKTADKVNKFLGL